MSFIEEIEKYRKLPPMFRGKQAHEFAQSASQSIQIDNLQKLNKQKYIEGFDDGVIKGTSETWEDAKNIHYSHGYKKGLFESTQSVLKGEPHIFIDKTGDTPRIFQAPDPIKLQQILGEADAKKYKRFIVDTKSTHDTDIYKKSSQVIQHKGGDMIYMDLGKILSNKQDVIIIKNIIKDANSGKYKGKETTASRNDIIDKLAPPPKPPMGKPKPPPRMKAITNAPTSPPTEFEDLSQYYTPPTSVPNTPAKNKSKKKTPSKSNPNTPIKKRGKVRK